MLNERFAFHMCACLLVACALLLLLLGLLLLCERLGLRGLLLGECVDALLVLGPVLLVHGVFFVAHGAHAAARVLIEWGQAQKAAGLADVL